MEEEHKAKKMKLSVELGGELPRCGHYVQRKKRFCKMTVAKGKEYCGEHDLPSSTVDQPNQPVQDDDRIACPLDSKHTVYRKNLKKHLTICNARPKDHPAYIVPGINSGSDDEDPVVDEVKILDVDPDFLENLIKRIEHLYTANIKDQIEEVLADHKIMSVELEKKEYGKETMKHIVQTSALLGYLEKFDMVQDQTAFVEFGAGKGQVSYWLAQLIGKESNSKIFLIDRASHRHKKDNKLNTKDDSVFRIRADIRDFCPDKLDHIEGIQRIIGISKHLCGAATDLALRCLLQKTSIPISGFAIAVCCHHRCEWKPFLGKKFFVQNGFNKKDFLLMTKMASWAICGDGYSREKRKEIEEQNLTAVGSSTKVKVSRERRAVIGNMCKRIIDYSRVDQMVGKNFVCSLKYYVRKDVTLENVCIIGKNKTIQKYVYFLLKLRRILFIRLPIPQREHYRLKRSTRRIQILAFSQVIEVFLGLNYLDWEFRK